MVTTVQAVLELTLGNDTDARTSIFIFFSAVRMENIMLHTPRGRGPAGGRGGGAMFSVDNRPTAVKISGLPSSATEEQVRAHASMLGTVVATAKTGRPGECLVKFADRR